MLKPNQTRVLLLDFDGVLHSPKAIAGARPLREPEQIRTGWPSKFEHLPILGEMLRGHPEIDVIVSSSWRHYLNTEQLADLLLPIKPWFAGTVTEGDRDLAIQECLAENDIQDYIVLDDQPLFFRDEWPTLILCNPERGIADPMVRAKIWAWLQIGWPSHTPNDLSFLKRCEKTACDAGRWSLGRLVQALN